MATGQYVMTISRMTVDKLGVKLYDKVSAVMAELVANSYDADATEVSIQAPMGVYLATAKGDAGHKIVVRDNGVGMEPDVVNPFYLKVGGERRKDPKRGNVSKKFGRRVMGRKGVGKLAPFGICNTIEVMTAGGELVDGTGLDGKPAKGYRVAHFVMKRSDIMDDNEDAYRPEIGRWDQCVVPEHGTTLTLTDFIRRMVPEMTTFSRQLSQRFGVTAADWTIKLIDSDKAAGTIGREAAVGGFDIETMLNTRVTFTGPATEVTSAAEMPKWKAQGPDGSTLPGFTAGFVHSDGLFYPVTGWVAYAKESYRDELMAGVRIYCRGKIAAQTPLFNLKSGFTGEYQIRSYLVGELQVDWLDESEDLIQTDRRDILWSDDLGKKLEEWGQSVVKLLGTLSREPLKKQVTADFLKAGNVVERIQQQFPGEEWKPIRETTLRIAKMMGERLRQGEIEDQDHVDSLVQLSLMLGPHVTLDDTLREAAEEGDGAVGVLASILRTARVAELSSYGMIAEKRVQVIEKIIGLKDDPKKLEQALQDSIEEAPWLINPQWSPITSNQSLSTLKKEFEKYFKKETGKVIKLDSFSDDSKRPDFVLSSQDFGLQIIEIKRTGHSIKNDEWDRIQVYIDTMDKFLSLPGHEDFRAIFKRFFVTLVCDEVGLTGAQKKAFDAYREDRVVEHITWTNFLRRTQHMHQDFLNEANRQKKLALTS
ncbi:MAG: ATP-binding protein [Novosphingobium sp.]